MPSVFDGSGARYERESQFVAAHDNFKEVFAGAWKELLETQIGLDQTNCTLFFMLDSTCFSDNNYFARQFRKIMNESPSAFRKRIA